MSDLRFQESIQEIIPTVGFSVEQLQRGKLSLTVFDMSGQGRYRTLWEHYYPDAEAIIFVMDATDRSRASMAREELDALLDHEAVRQRPIPVLVLANKSDLTQAMLASECSNFLGLDRIKQRPWSISACSALTGEGLTPGLDWLLERL